LRSLHINAGIAQAPDMVLPGRQDGALATIGAITDEREQRVIFRLCEEKKALTCRCWRSIERAKGMGAAVEFTVDS
jgi:hypothetical protein